MIPVSSATLDTSTQIQASEIGESWQKLLSDGFRSASQLLDYLSIDSASLPYRLDMQTPFRTKVTRHFADLIDPANPYDPILLQVLPLIDECLEVADFTADPLQEDHFQVLPGLIHKYRNRVLIIAHQACAIHCRYCFRRHFPYSEARLSESALTDIENYISKHPEINEVIFSGGDPLSLSDPALKALLQRFDKLAQINTLRVHSRTPVVLPQRLSPALIEAVKSLQSRVVLVTHINHPQELSPQLTQALKPLAAAGVLLLNQTVLLKHINDCSTTLSQLSEKLFACGILPYYLHSLDPVSGAAHFDVSESDAQSIWNDMQANLSGYLLPRLVREIPEKASKTWINKQRVSK